MTITISDGASPFSPVMALGLSSKRSGNATPHQLLNGAVAATLGAMTPRSGTLQLLFLNEADALNAEFRLKAALTFTYVDTTRSSYNMTFVIPTGGGVTRTLDEATRQRFTVSVDFQEIS